MVRTIEIEIHEIEYDPYTKKHEFISGKRMTILDTKITPAQIVSKLKRVI